MIPASVRIFVCTEPQDLRGSFDRLALAAQQRLGEDPQGWSALLLRQPAFQPSEGPVVGSKRLLPLVQAAAPRAVPDPARGAEACLRDPHRGRAARRADRGCGTRTEKTH